MPGSLLDLAREDLPPLLHAEIAVEIARRDPPLDQPGRGLLAGAVLADGWPLDLLDLCARRLADGIDGELPLPQRLRRWQQARRRERWTPSPRWLLGLRHRATAAWRTAGLPPPREAFKCLKDLLRFGRGRGGGGQG